ALTNPTSLRIVPSYQVPASANVQANYFQQEQAPFGLYMGNAISDAASNGWVTALNNQSSLATISSRIISQTQQSINNMSLFGINLGFNVSANNVSYNYTPGTANMTSSGLSLSFNRIPNSGDFYAGLDQSSNTLWLEYVVHNNSATLHVDIA